MSAKCCFLSEVSEPILLPSKKWEKSHLVSLSIRLRRSSFRFSIAGFLVPAPQLLPDFSKWCRSKQCPSCCLNPNVVDPMMAPLTAPKRWSRMIKYSMNEHKMDGFPIVFLCLFQRFPSHTKTAPHIRVPSNWWNFQPACQESHKAYTTFLLNPAVCLPAPWGGGPRK